ncbi:hypothetical protein AV530_003030 [Patagioenas fasciata monilis]|uniref:Uncharacterized protein n=1 Tax=Patagioenas fasciata monilis TaxID=372326 RepID=A0A1V4KVP1_PATFA|nr:hypothetical protein AV530_003030 [Patagioenas fasciata monilis]
MRADKCSVPKALVTSADPELTGDAASSQPQDSNVDLAGLGSTWGWAIEKVITLLKPMAPLCVSVASLLADELICARAAISLFGLDIFSLT